MKLVVFNGSPRRTKSNSSILTDHFLKGYYSYVDSHVCISYLADVSKTFAQIEQFMAAEAVIIIFPLYTDAMPGQVKYFLEQLDKIDTKYKKVGFIVQSGFPEAYHSTFVKCYLDKFAQRNKWNYLGTVIRGGVEGIQVMTPAMTKNLFANFEKLGKIFAQKGIFDQETSKKLATPYRLNFLTRLAYRFLILTGMSNFYWNMKLKENHAYDRRFAQPYITK